MKPAMQSMPEGRTAADSVAESSPGLRRLAGLVVVVCALASVIPR